MRSARLVALTAASVGLACTSLTPAAAQPAAATAPATATATATAAAPPAAPAVEAGPKPMTESVAAVINNEVITTYDLRQRVRLLIVSTGVQPTEQNLPQIEREALRALIDERLQSQELAKVEARGKSKIFPSDKEVNAEIDDMAASYNVKGPQLLKSLEGAGIEPATLRDQLRVQLGWRKYIGGRFHDNVRVGDDQVSAMMTRITASAAKPQYLVSEVFVDALRTGGQAQAQQGAAQLSGELKKGAPFAAVARQFSALPTAANGGDAGWLTAGEIQPELQAALEALKPGQISEPIPVADGVYILQLREKRAGSTAMMVDMKQAAMRLPKDASPADVAAANTKLEALRKDIKSCDKMDAIKSDGVAVGDLGETSLEDLSPDFRKAIDGLKPGEVSAPVRTSAGLHLVVLCSRRVGGAKEPTRAEVENKIYGEQLGMIARRFLRDLRNSAAIENR